MLICVEKEKSNYLVAFKTIELSNTVCKTLLYTLRWMTNIYYSARLLGELFVFKLYQCFIPRKHEDIILEFNLN